MVVEGTYRKLHESAICSKVTGSPVMFHVDEDTCLPSVINFYMEREFLLTDSLSVMQTIC